MKSFRGVSVALFTETGIPMNLPVEVRSVLWCIISQRPIQALGVPTFTSGMMTGATWSTTTSASMNQVGNSRSRYSRFCAYLLIFWSSLFIFRFHCLWLFVFLCCETWNYFAACHSTQCPEIYFMLQSKLPNQFIGRGWLDTSGDMTFLTLRSNCVFVNRVSWRINIYFEII